MYFDVYQDSLTDATLEVNGKAFQLDKDFNPSIGNIPATLRFSEVVMIGANSTDSLKNANLAGKLVMIVGNVPSARRGQGGGLLSSASVKGHCRYLIGEQCISKNQPAQPQRQSIHQRF